MPSLKNLSSLIKSRLFESLGIGLFESLLVVFLLSSGFSELLISNIFGLNAMLSFLVAFNLPRYLNKFNLSGTLKKVLFTSGLLFILFPFLENYYLLFVLIILSLLSIIRTNFFDFLVGSLVSKRKLASFEGYLYGGMNLGWLVGPLVAIPFLKSYSFKLGFILVGLFLVFSSYLLKSYKFKPQKVMHFANFMKDKQLILSYLLSSGVEFWWAIIYIYMPILIVKSLPGAWVGIYLALIVIPLILIEPFLGKINLYLNSRSSMYISYISLFILTFSMYFFPIGGKMVLGFLGSLFLGIIEPTQDVIFFKKVSKDHLGLYSYFSTAGYVGFFLGNLVVTLTLLVSSLEYFFLPYSLFFLGFAFVAKNLKKPY